MKSYTVQYKYPYNWRWKTLSEIKEDGMNDGANSRYFISLDNTRIEISVTAEFRFSPDRDTFIQLLRAKEQAKLKGAAIPGIAHPSLGG